MRSIHSSVDGRILARYLLAFNTRAPSIKHSRSLSPSIKHSRSPSIHSSRSLFAVHGYTDSLADVRHVYAAAQGVISQEMRSHS
jgi:hypothetical protein